MTAEQAKKRCTRVNNERRLKKDEIRARINAANNLLSLESVDETLFPAEYVEAFADHLDSENFGSETHLKKLYSQFNFVQKMMKSLRLTPDRYKEDSKRIHKYFVKQKVSIDYAKKIISMTNRWGLFACKQQGQFFEPVSIPKGRPRSAIVDAQQTKTGKNTELGVRTESEPLTPEILKQSKDSFTNPNHHNFLTISLWFGLRPYEVDLLKDKKKWNISRDKQTGVLSLEVYQTKLMSVEENKRYKFIPVLFKEQHEALKLIKAQTFDRPHPKTVRKNLKANITLYGGRKRFTDLMLDRDQKIEDISLWLGHRSLSTTWSRYKQKQKVSFVKNRKIVY